MFKCFNVAEVIDNHGHTRSGVTKCISQEL